MIYHHKNPNSTLSVFLFKIRYRDEKRMKIKIQLFGKEGAYGQPFNATVSPNFFKNYQLTKSIPCADHEDLLKLDQEKEDYILEG